MFRHVWYELTGNFILHFIELLKIPSSFSSGVKAPVYINLHVCQALWTCAGVTSAQGNNVERIKEEASDRATQVTVDLIRRKSWVLNSCLFACAMSNGWFGCTQWWISLYLAISSQC